MKDNKLRVDLEFNFDRENLEIESDFNYDIVPLKKQVTIIREVKIERARKKKTIDSSTKLF
jgi:hypothetical protein